MKANRSNRSKAKKTKTTIMDVVQKEWRVAKELENSALFRLYVNGLATSQTAWGWKDSDGNYKPMEVVKTKWGRENKYIKL